MCQKHKKFYKISKKDSIIKINKYISGIILGIAAFVTAALLFSFSYRLFNHRDIDIEIEQKIVRNDSLSESIQLNVLNSTQTPGIADKARTYLRNNNFDVVEIGNFPEHKKFSIIYDRVGDKASALKIALSMGISDSLIFTKKDSSLFLKATVILGDDYKALAPFR